MDVVIARAMRQLQHHILLSRTVRHRILLDIRKHARRFITLRIGLRRLHETLGVMAVIQGPVIHAAAGNPAAEHVRVPQQQHRRHRAAEGETLHADAFSVHIRQRLEIVRPGQEIPHRHVGQVAIDQVGAGPAVVSGSPAVRHDMDDALFAPPLVLRQGPAPAVPHVSGARTAVDFKVDRILFGRVEIPRQRHGRRDQLAVLGRNRHDLRQGIARSVEFRSPGIGDLQGAAGGPVIHMHALRRAFEQAAVLPGQGRETGLVQPDLGRGREIGQRRDEVFPIRAETHVRHAQARIRQGCDPAVGIGPVQAGAHRRIPVGREIDRPRPLVDPDQADAPVGAVGQPAEFLAVIRKEIHLLPAGLERAGHVQSLVREDHIIDPVQPGLIGLVIDELLAAVQRTDAIQVQRILDARLPGDVEGLPVRAPERRAEVLVLLRVEIRPDRLARHFFGRRIERERLDVDHADAHFGIALPRLGVARAAQGAVLPSRRIDGEHRHFAVVETVEADAARIGRPPEGPVAGRAAENLLVIHPGGIAVQDHFRSVEGQPFLPAGGQVIDKEVVVPGEGQHRRIRRPGQIDGPVRLDRRIYRVRPFGHRGRGDHLERGRHDVEDGRIGIDPVVGKSGLRIGNPFPGDGHRLELLRDTEGAAEKRSRQEKQSSVHHSKKRSLKLTR